jgi:hypothetical protein
MNSERDEADLRLALAPLRRRDEALRPPFATMWSAAERRVAASRPSGSPYRWIAAGTFAALILAVVLVERPQRHALEVADRGAQHALAYDILKIGKASDRLLPSVPPYVDPLSAWRSPTRFLLAADPELWRSTPRFGPSKDYSLNFPAQEI